MSLASATAANGGNFSDIAGSKNISQQLYDFSLKSKPNQGHQMDQQFADAVTEQKQ